MYYCKSRYYVPEWRRWLNEDHLNYLSTDEILNLNLNMFCFNNPVTYMDDSGNSPWWHWAIAGAVLTGGTLVGAVLAGAAVGASTNVITSAISGEMNLGQFALDTGVGALSGLSAVVELAELVQLLLED